MTILQHMEPTAGVAMSTQTPFIILDGNLHRANFVWDEFQDSTRHNNIMRQNPPYHRYYEMNALIPFTMMLIIAALIFILMIFRRWPSLVAGIVAGFLTSIAIYLVLLTLKEEKIVYE